MKCRSNVIERVSCTPAGVRIDFRFEDPSRDGEPVRILPPAQLRFAEFHGVYVTRDRLLMQLRDGRQFVAHRQHLEGQGGIEPTRRMLMTGIRTQGWSKNNNRHSCADPTEKGVNG